MDGRRGRTALAHGTGGSAVEQEASGHPEQSLQDAPKMSQGLVGRAPSVPRDRFWRKLAHGDSLTLGRISPSHPACGERVVSVWLVAYLSLASLRGKDQANPLYWLTLHLTLPNDFCGVSASPVKACQNPQTCPIMSRRGRPTAVLQSDPLSTSPKNSTERASLASRAHCARVWFSIPANASPMKRGQGCWWDELIAG